jgi:hypothetical protein
VSRESEPHAPAAGLNTASPTLLHVLESAARLQELVPDAVLVGGSAAALYAGHRDSHDHDHVLENLSERFDTVLDAVESEDGWVTNRVVPGKIILGRIGDIEAGVRQLIRRTPLETATLMLPSGHHLTVPTDAETLRVKAFLIVRRNQTRDYLDAAAVSDLVGIPSAGATLRGMDDYYADQHGGGDGVASQVYRQLSDPRPADSRTTTQLDRYKNLAPRWQDWAEVRRVCQAVADAMLDDGGFDDRGEAS